MTPKTWPAMMPFDPETGEFPPALEALFARPPATVPAVLVVAGAAARRDGWAAKAAIAIATGWAARRDRITLAELAGAAPELEGRLGLESAEGLADVFEFGLSLGRAARAVPGRTFRFLSPGLYLPNPAALLEHPRWERLVFQHAEQQATLLAYVAAESAGLESLARRVGKALILAAPDELPGIAAALPTSCSVLAVLRGPGAPAAPEPEPRKPSSPLEVRLRTVRPDVRTMRVDPVAADPVTERDLLTEPTFIQREPRRRRRVSPVLWLLLLATLGLGGWFGAQSYLDIDRPDLVALQYVAGLVGVPLPEGLTPPGSAASPTGTAAPPAGTAGTPAGAAGTPGAEGAALESPLSYSITLEAHPDFATAQERVEWLRGAEPGIPFYVAPIMSDGVVYYRVLAGMAADTVAASALLRLLNEKGHKTDVDPWSIRPTVWTYRLGEYVTHAAAAGRADTLLTHGVPTYIVEIPYTVGPPRYRLYAGAYEGPAQGSVMAVLLERAGIEAQLVRRMGAPVE